MGEAGFGCGLKQGLGIGLFVARSSGHVLHGTKGFGFGLVQILRIAMCFAAKFGWGLLLLLRLVMFSNVSHRKQIEPVATRKRVFETQCMMCTVAQQRATDGQHFVRVLPARPTIDRGSRGEWARAAITQHEPAVCQ